MSGVEVGQGPLIVESKEASKTTEVAAIKESFAKPFFEVTNDEPLIRITALAYGVSGSGKTYLGGSFPDPVFMDAQGGVRATLRGHVPPIRYRVVESWEDALAFRREVIRSECQTVVVDTSTELCRLALKSELKQSGKLTASQAIWGQVVEKINTFLREIQSENPTKHILVTAQERLEKDEDVGRVFIRPNLTGQLASKVGELFDGVWHLQTSRDTKTGDTIRVMLTQPDSLYPAKQRAPSWALLDRLEVPDFKVIWGKLSKGKVQA